MRTVDQRGPSFVDETVGAPTAPGIPDLSLEDTSLTMPAVIPSTSRAKDVCLPVVADLKHQSP